MSKLSLLFLFVVTPPLAVFAQSGVVINEIMYAPKSPEPEWIELYNMDSTVVDLTGWVIATTSKTGTLPAASISGHRFIVLTKDSAALIAWRPGNYTIVQGPLPDLPNAGTQLLLKNAGLQTIDSVPYLPSWGGSSSASLERRNVSGTSSDPTNWGTSIAPTSAGETSATPGAKNSLASSDSTPTYIPANPLDVVINEIMFAPVSPEPEWIELLNTANDTIDLSHWQITIGTNTPRTIAATNTKVAPDSMVVLSANPTPLAQIDSIAPFKIVQVSLPTLLNTGSTLALRDPLGDLIDTIAYNGNWIASNGTSIERIDPGKAGSIPSNWAACSDPKGSTILRPNSCRIRTYDLALIGARVTESNLYLEFKNIGKDTVANTTLSVIIGDRDTVKAMASEAIAPGNTIEVPVLLPENIFGMWHATAVLSNPLDERPSNDTLLCSIDIPIPEDSLVINEIMFDPTPASCEWVELYNRTKRWISLDSTRLITGEKRPAEYTHTITPLIIAPDSFGVIAADVGIFFSTYPRLRDRDGVAGLGVSTLDLGHDSCFLTLHDLDSTCIDSVHYLKGWQQSLVRKSFIGISLERKDPGMPSDLANNWQASIDSSGATPLAKNSIASSTIDSVVPIGTSFVTSFAPNPFSPDGDGFEDASTLTIQTGDATTEWALRVRLFDLRGQIVRTLADAVQMIGATTILFDGRKDNGQTLMPGLYTALIELSSQNPVRTMKQVVGVAIAGKRR